MSNRIYNVNDSYFDIIDSEDKAYFLGLMMADGCNYEEDNTIKIDLSVEDIYILESFKEYIDFYGDVKIYDVTKPKFNGIEYHRSKMARLVFSSDNISKRLNELGCIPHKSFTEHHLPTYNQVPEELYNHFMRGYFDGNGGISYWTDNKDTGHKKFQVNCCGQEDIIKDIANYMQKHFDCKPAISKRYKDRNNHNLQFNICGNRIVKNILDWFYADATIYLKRKHDKYLVLYEEIKRKEGNKGKLYGNCNERRKVIYHPLNIIFSSVTEAAKVLKVTTSTICNRCKNENNKDIEYYIESKNQLSFEDMLNLQFGSSSMYSESLI